MTKTYLSPLFKVGERQGKFADGTDAGQWFTIGFGSGVGEKIPFTEKPEKLYEEFLQAKTDEQIMTFMNKYGLSLVRKEFVSNPTPPIINNNYVIINVKQFRALQDEFRGVYEKFKQGKLEKSDIRFVEERARAAESERVVQEYAFLGEDEAAANTKSREIENELKGYSGEKKVQKHFEILQEKRIPLRKRWKENPVDIYCLLYKELVKEICRTPLEKKMEDYRKDEEHRNNERIRSWVYRRKDKSSLKKMMALMKQLAQRRWFDKGKKDEHFSYKIDADKLTDVLDELNYSYNELKTLIDEAKGRKYLEYRFDEQNNLRYNFLI